MTDHARTLPLDPGVRRTELREARLTMLFGAERYRDLQAASRHVQIGTAALQEARRLAWESIACVERALGVEERSARWLG